MLFIKQLIPFVYVRWSATGDKNVFPDVSKVITPWSIRALVNMLLEVQRVRKTQFGMPIV